MHIYNALFLCFACSLTLQSPLPDIEAGHGLQKRTLKQVIGTVGRSKPIRTISHVPRLEVIRGPPPQLPQPETIRGPHLPGFPSGLITSIPGMGRLFQVQQEKLYRPFGRYCNLDKETRKTLENITKLPKSVQIPNFAHVDQVIESPEGQCSYVFFDKLSWGKGFADPFGLSTLKEHELKSIFHDMINAINDLHDSGYAYGTITRDAFLYSPVNGIYEATLIPSGTTKKYTKGTREFQEAADKDTAELYDIFYLTVNHPSNGYFGADPSAVSKEGAAWLKGLFSFPKPSLKEALKSHYMQNADIYKFAMFTL